MSQFSNISKEIAKHITDEMFKQGISPYVVVSGFLKKIDDDKLSLTRKFVHSELNEQDVKHIISEYIKLEIERQEKALTVLATMEEILVENTK